MLRRLACLATLLLAGGCDCSNPVDPPECASADDCPAGMVCRDELCVPDSDAGPGGPDAGPGRDGGGGRPDAGPPACTSNDDCDGEGVCNAGVCCADADSVCGAGCCGDGETCFASACVVPGDVCRSSADCEDGEYCEPALGDGPSGGADGGAPMPDGGVAGACLGEAPDLGRCVALPPDCDGAPAPGEVCIEPGCEFRPPVGALNAVAQWRWDDTNVETHSRYVDVWATPVVGRVTDTNCDGVVDEFDPPNIIFVSGDNEATQCASGAAGEHSCRHGALRVLDGLTGREVWSLRSDTRDGDIRFSGLSVAIGDVDHDGDMEIAAVRWDGHIVLVDHTGVIVATSDTPIRGDWNDVRSYGWGGGLTLGDMDQDGNPEIAYGRVVYSTDGATITRRWEGTQSWGGGATRCISQFGDFDGDPLLELLAGDTLYDTDGSVIWDANIGEGYSAPANFDADPEPEIAFVVAGTIRLLSSIDGSEEVTALTAPGPDPGSGGPVTIADFDGDGQPEIGIAFKDNYVVAQVNAAGDALEQLWATPNHDFSSSVTGSTVFDFEGDGAAEVIYNDECFLWVYDGATGAVRFATPTTSFTATEASLVADVDGDGSAEIVMVSNGASPSTVGGWDCDGVFNGTDWTMPAAPTDPDFGRPGWVGSDGVATGGAAYHGITVWRAADNSWVGTRSLWNQHAYSVSNICGDRGDACTPASTYGDIPRVQVANWTVGFLNNFRQNIQGEGIFDAPDATVSLAVRCTTPVELTASVRNLGAAVLAAGVEVAVYLVEADGTERELGRATTSNALFPGQVEALSILAPADVEGSGSVFRARILVDPSMPTFQECRDDNNQSADIEPSCLL